jgi:hypothetical protein
MVLAALAADRQVPSSSEARGRSIRWSIPTPGIALVAGLYARFAALLLLPIMVGTIATVRVRNDGRSRPMRGQ